MGLALLSLDALLISRRVWQVGEFALCGPWQLAHLRVVWEQGFPVVWQVGQIWWHVLCSLAQSWYLTFFLQTVEWCPKPWHALHWLLGCVSLYAAYLVCTAPISRPFLITPSASCFILKQSSTEEWSFRSLTSFLVNHLGGAASWMLLL